jgi:transcriptional regulator with GAF, ATPase, and Fis domain
VRAISIFPHPKRARTLDLREARRRAERDAIEMALAQAEGNISRAAKALGVRPPDSLRPRQEHGISVKLNDFVRAVKPKK